MAEIVELFDWLWPPREKRRRRYYRLGLACALPLVGAGVLFLLFGSGGSSLIVLGRNALGVSA